MERDPQDAARTHAVEPSVLHRCDAWMVINKPAGWHTVSLGGTDAHAQTHEDPGSECSERGPTVESWLCRAMPEQAAIEEAGIVHRLDLFTSGCLLVARSAAERDRLRRAISEHGAVVRKIYLAITRSGIAGEGDFELHFRGRHRRSSKVTVSADGAVTERGQCRWTRRASTPIGDLVEVELIGPGRRHQIRAGLAHLGFPLCGDALYRGDAPLVGLEGPALHAWKLVVDSTSVEAPLPPAWSQFHSAVSRRTEGVNITRPTQIG